MVFLIIILYSGLGLVDVESMRTVENRVRLDTAFTVADNELGIARCLLAFFKN